MDQLAAQYIKLFPENVGTLALDAIVQHSQSKAADIFIGASSYGHVSRILLRVGRY